MLKKIISIIFIILLSCQTAIAPPILDEAYDAGSWMIAKGLEAFLFLIGDTIYSAASDNVTESHNRSETDQKIVALMVWNPNPFDNKTVQDWQNYSMCFYIILTAFILVLAFIKSTKIMQSIDQVFDTTYTQNILINTILVLLVIPTLSLFLCSIILLVNNILSQTIIDYTIFTVPASSSNSILYIFMAIAFFILSICMIARILLIYLFTAFCIICGTMYSISEYRDTAIDLFRQFISVVILQPKLLLIFLFGSVLAENLPAILKGVTGVYFLSYAATVFVMVVVGYNAIFGNLLSKAFKIIIIRRVI